MALTRPKVWDIDTNITAFNDPITVLHQGATAANVDVGFLFNRANGLVSNVAVYWSEQGNTFVTAFTNNTGATNSNVATNGYANLTVGSLITINGAGLQLGAGSGFILNGSRGNSGDVLTSTGSGVQWAAAGGFSGGVVPNQLIANASQNSTSVSTGAFIVPYGGVGIAGNLNVNSAGYFGYQASLTPLINPSIIGTSSSQAVNAGQYYVQSALINTSPTGSADIVAYPNNISDGSTGFMDMGFTSNSFSDPAYTITKANDGYLFASAVAGSTRGGNLVLATDSTGTYRDIVFATGSFYSNAEVARFRGNTSNSGYLQITTGTQSVSSVTGALVVTGGVGISKDLWVGGNIYTANLVSTTTSQLNVSAPLVYLTGAPYPYNYDIGMYSHFIGGPANVYSHTGLTRNYTNNTWTFFSNVASEPINTINWSDSGIIYDTVKMGNITIVSNTATRGGKPMVTNYTGNTAPSSPVQGDEWFRANTSVMYKYLYDNISNTYNWVDMTSGLYAANTAAASNTLALRDANASITANVFIGIASSAKYADLAEIYESDKVYLPGTVVVFGGTKEITVTKKTHDTRVAGVISTNPAYLMNNEATGLPVAFTGRVPCLVKGPVTKGDVLVTSAHERYAERLTMSLYQPGCVLGKALGEVADNEFATIEVVVGRF